MLSRHDARGGAATDPDLLLQQRPVECVVVLVVESAEQNAEKLAQIHVVGRLVESQTAAVVQIHGEFGWETLQTFTS